MSVAATIHKVLAKFRASPSKVRTAGPKNKVLLVFCDGTGDDGLLASETEDTQPDDGTQEATNVLRLSRAVNAFTSDGRRQIVFYQSGVGSEAGFDGQPDPTTILLQALGTTVASKIRDAYAFIAQNFEDGDDICIYGFSRGAYTARKVAGLIDKVGLLESETLGYLFDIWQDLISNKPPTIPPGTRQTRIRCVGVWDTVGSVINSIDELNIKDNSLPPTVDCALHALSIQENRKSFLPTLWTVPSSGLTTLPDGTTQVLKQIWFPGAHSDIGGGYERHELSDITLFWMAGEIEGFVSLDLDFLRASGQTQPDPWGTTQPHNGYEETSAVEALIVGHETRLESGQITATTVFHPSLQVSPTILTNATYMVTLPILQSTFGGSWSPTYSTLNAFEELCKQQWGQPVPDTPGKTRMAPKFETPASLFIR